MKKSDLLAAIEADPTDRAALSVYSDFLIEKDDPFGEIVAGALAGKLDPDLTTQYEKEHFADFCDGWTTEWDPATGFLRAIELETEQAGDFVRAIAKTPATRLLQKLELVAIVDEYEEGAGPSNLFAALKKKPFPRSLKELDFSLDRRDPDDEEASRDLTELLPHVPFVEVLTLNGVLRLGTNAERLAREADALSHLRELLVEVTCPELDAAFGDRVKVMKGE